jgi:hypothetical protein
MEADRGGQEEMSMNMAEESTLLWPPQRSPYVSLSRQSSNTSCCNKKWNPKSTSQLPCIQAKKIPNETHSADADQGQTWKV